VQIVDSLTDYMRDLMVVKSTGPESELLVLTTEQRQRAGQLAEKFDVAGLVYNITALEKLRWSIKNSDTPRALLDALLLRFALSEHFMNVDELMARLQGGATSSVKKKEPTSTGNKASQSPTPSMSEPSPKPSALRPTPSREKRRTNNEQTSKPQTTIEEQNQIKATPNRLKISSQKKNEIINDPAVKTVLMGLDATITGIDEDQSN